MVKETILIVMSIILLAETAEASVTLTKKIADKLPHTTGLSINTIVVINKIDKKLSK